MKSWKLLILYTRNDVDIQFLFCKISIYDRCLKIVSSKISDLKKEEASKLIVASNLNSFDVVII
jgi:hypothetical protein